MTKQKLEELLKLCKNDSTATTEDVVRTWRLLKELVNELVLAPEYQKSVGQDLKVAIKAIHTKFNDAGRRSAPWRAFSKRTPGRPQDGSDGNRINRWLLPNDHKFYATEKDATLVQIRYYLQFMSMENAPIIPHDEIVSGFRWLCGHDIAPGNYLDPIQLIKCDIIDFFNDRRSITSGHLIPLDRGGRHHFENTFLMPARSNQLQGNLTLDELLDLLKQIVKRHEARPT